MSGRIQTQADEITTLKTQMSPLWARVQKQISENLHQPHPRYFEMDRLLEKLDALVITDKERIRLKILLEERSKDFHEDISEQQRKEAAVMIKIMDLVLIEEANSDSAPTV